MAKTGRPLKEIPKLEFESLLYIGCQRQEIVDYFDFQFRMKSKTGKTGISDSTIDRWCKRTYGCSFAEMLRKGQTKLKIKLRRNQIKLSENNASMAIFLGKQYLGQSDKQEIEVTNNEPVIEEMEAYFADKKRNS